MGGLAVGDQPDGSRRTALTAVTGHSRLAVQGANQAFVKLSRELVHEPRLQTGQAHLGAQGSHCRELARDRRAPRGQPDWGLPPQPPTGSNRLVKQARNPAEKTSIKMRLKPFFVQDLGC